MGLSPSEPIDMALQHGKGEILREVKRGLALLGHVWSFRAEMEPRNDGVLPFHSELSQSTFDGLLVCLCICICLCVWFICFCILHCSLVSECAKSFELNKLY